MTYVRGRDAALPHGRTRPGLSPGPLGHDLGNHPVEVHHLDAQVHLLAHRDHGRGQHRHRLHGNGQAGGQSSPDPASCQVLDAYRLGVAPEAVPHFEA